MRRSHVLLLSGLFGLFFAACGPTYPKCNNYKDCHEKEFCVNGQCQQCRDDTDCPGQKCNRGRCEAGAAGGCTDDSQCPDNQSCIGGACKPCTADSQCGVGGKCKSGRCQRAQISDSDQPIAPGNCSLESVYFDFNESSLSTEATSAIDRDADCLKKNRSKPLSLIGRTDPRGTEEYNLALSDKRAQAVKERLGRLGLETGSYKTVAKGELEATGKDESGWARDRRVDFQW